MAKITIDSYKDSVGGINEPFQELRDGLNVINQHWDDDGSYMYGDIIWREQGWQRGSIWYEGNFLYDSSGYLDNNSVIKKAITKMDDGSGRSWTSEINWSFHDIVNAVNSPEQWDSFLKTTYSGNDTIESTGGGSITANTYNGNDTITVSSGNNNNINGGSGNDSITINSNASGIFFGGDDHDEITNYSETAIANGGKGNDILNGGSSNNLLRGGNGRDVLTGGNGGDKLYGDFGLNTFTGERGDGYADEIYIKSDHLLYNHLYDKANNNTNGIKRRLYFKILSIIASLFF